jgi:ribosome-associated toxin RatA of RatAB toxin-antitoxin module
VWIDLVVKGGKKAMRLVKAMSLLRAAVCHRTGAVVLLFLLFFLLLNHPRRLDAGQTAQSLEKALAESRRYQVETIQSLKGSERKKIEKGEVAALLEDIPGSPVKIGRGIGVLPYPPEVVWQVLNDYNNYKDFMPFTKESRVDPARSSGEVVYFYSELSFPLISDRYYSLRVSSEERVEGKHRTYFISWTLDPEKKSNLYLNSGSWKLVPHGPEGGKTLAFYTVLTDPGGSIPNFLKNKSTAIGIPSVFEGISNRAREGLSARIYKLPLPEDKLDTLMRKRLETSRSHDSSYPETLSADQRSALDQGEVLLSLTDMEGTWVKVAEAVSLVKMPASRLFQVLSAYDQYQDFMPYVRECRADQERGKGNVAYLSYRLHFRLFPYIRDRYFTVKLIEEVEVEGEPGVYYLSWSLDPEQPANINRNSGFWKLVPCGKDHSDTLVFYTVLADPGGLSPWFLKNISAKRIAREIFDAVRARAGEPVKSEP